MNDISDAEEKVPDLRIDNIDVVKDLWSKTYNTEGKPDWSHILPYYDNDILFRDSIQEIRGNEGIQGNDRTADTAFERPEDEDRQCHQGWRYRIP